MIRTFGALSAVVFLLCLTQSGASAAETIRGLVVERDGQGVEKADVRFFSEGRDVGHGKSDRSGRFAVDVTQTPQTWSASAKGYETQTLRFSSAGSPTIVLYPRDASSPGKLTGADFAVLPYQDVGYDFALAPFQVIQGGGSISTGDRGLSGSANALQDNGSSFASVPAHYLAFAGIAGAFHAYRYSHGSAGHYTLGFDRSAGSAFESGAGSLRVELLQGRFGDAAIGYGASTGDLTEHSRFDAIARSNLGAGKLLLLAGRSFTTDNTGSAPSLGDETSTELRLDEPWLGSTATFELKAKRKNKNKIADYIEGDSEIEGELRLKNDGALFGNEIGVKLVRDTGVRNHNAKIYSGQTLEDRIFASESYSGNRVQARLSLAWYGLHDSGVTHKAPAGLSQTASGIAPALQVQWQISDRFAVQAMRGNVEDTPTVSDQYFSDPIPGLVLNRSNVTEGSLLYHSPGRFEAELTAFSEKYTTAFPTTQLHGLGAAVDWPIARDWRLRAWTLSLVDTMNGTSQSDLGPSSGRDVAWLTYYGGRTTRFDVIYRRETDPVEMGRYIDADAAIAIGPQLSLVGTMEHHHSTSAYGVSLRFETTRQ